MAVEYGKWQNTECTEMKDTLLNLQTEAEQGSGLVSFDTFHSQPKHAHYTFVESADYLQQIGALDEVEEENPRVLIANYLAGSSNCIASSKYVSVCCLSECE